MNSATQGMFLILSAVCLIYGLSDLADQYKAGQELRWTMPIVLIGCGVGIPLVIFPLSDYLGVDESIDSKDDYDSSVSEFDSGGSGE